MIYVVCMHVDMVVSALNAGCSAISFEISQCFFVIIPNVLVDNGIYFCTYICGADIE